MTVRVSYMGKKTVWTENGKVCLPNKTKLKEIQSCFGLVFQNFNLFPHYTVMKNITDAPIHVQKRNKDEVYREARDLLAKMGLSDKEDAYPYQLVRRTVPASGDSKSPCTESENPVL